MGLGFRVGKGVRLYGSSRGLGVSAGAGPVRVYAPLTGGRRSSGTRRTGPTLAQQLAAIRRQQRAEEVQAAADLDLQLIDLCNVHTEEFVSAQPWKAELPAPVSERELAAELERQALEGVSRFDRSGRKAAKAEAASGLSAAVAAETARRHEAYAARKAELDGIWNSLVSNDPDTVIGMLEQAFADNETPAAAVSCQGLRVDMVIMWPEVGDVVPEKKAALTPSGAPTIHKRPKNEIAEFYLWALCSSALVTIKEAFAVCPSIEQAGIAVVRCVDDPMRGDQTVEPVFLGTVDRIELDGINWSEIKPIATMLGLFKGRIGMKGKGANKTLFRLRITEPDEVAFLTQVGEALERRLPDGAVNGIALPVHVSHS